MRCDYCGRTNTNDGHGGCIKCGAPITQTYQPPREYSYMDSTCYTAPLAYARQPISRKRIHIE